MGNYGGAAKRLLLTAILLGSLGVLGVTREAGASDGTITDIIYQEAARYGVSGDWLYWTAYCESTLNPWAVGRAGERGLFQWHPRGLWWDTPAGRAGNPIPVGNIRLDISMAAWAFSRGLSFHWTCAR